MTKECEICKGSGRLEEYVDGELEVWKCDNCDGKGVVRDED